MLTRSEEKTCESNLRKVLKYDPREIARSQASGFHSKRKYGKAKRQSNAEKRGDLCSKL